MAAISPNFKKRIENKLLERDPTLDADLLEFVFMLIENKRPKATVEEELRDFFGNDSSSFTEWLFGEPEMQDTPAVSNSRTIQMNSAPPPATNSTVATSSRRLSSVVVAGPDSSRSSSRRQESDDHRSRRGERDSERDRDSYGPSSRRGGRDDADRRDPYRPQRSDSHDDRDSVPYAETRASRNRTEGAPAARLLVKAVKESNDEPSRPSVKRISGPEASESKRSKRDGNEDSDLMSVGLNDLVESPDGSLLTKKSILERVGPKQKLPISSRIGVRNSLISSDPSLTLPTPPARLPVDARLGPRSGSGLLPGGLNMIQGLPLGGPLMASHAAINSLAALHMKHGGLPPHMMIPGSMGLTPASLPNMFGFGASLSQQTPKQPQPAPATTVSPLPAAPVDTSSIPCKAFPHCKYMSSCRYKHPSVPCKFGLRCENSACNYVHPSTATAKTSNAPPCKFGDKCRNPACAFAHPKMCRYGAQCTRPDCTYSHPPREASQTPCRFGAKCNKEGCPYLHTHISDRKFVSDEASFEQPAEEA